MKYSQERTNTMRR